MSHHVSKGSSNPSCYSSLTSCRLFLLIAVACPRHFLPLFCSTVVQNIGCRVDVASKSTKSKQPVDGERETPTTHRLIGLGLAEDRPRVWDILGHEESRECVGNSRRWYLSARIRSADGVAGGGSCDANLGIETRASPELWKMSTMSKRRARVLLLLQADDVSRTGLHPEQGGSEDYPPTCGLAGVGGGGLMKKRENQRDRELGDHILKLRGIVALAGRSTTEVSLEPSFRVFTDTINSCFASWKFQKTQRFRRCCDMIGHLLGDYQL